MKFNPCKDYRSIRSFFRTVVTVNRIYKKTEPSGEHHKNINDLHASILSFPLNHWLLFQHVIAFVFHMQQ